MADIEWLRKQLRNLEDELSGLKDKKSEYIERQELVEEIKRNVIDLSSSHANYTSFSDFRDGGAHMDDITKGFPNLEGMSIDFLADMEQDSYTDNDLNSCVFNLDSELTRIEGKIDEVNGQIGNKECQIENKNREIAAAEEEERRAAEEAAEG